MRNYQPHLLLFLLFLLLTVSCTKDQPSIHQSSIPVTYDKMLSYLETRDIQYTGLFFKDQTRSNSQAKISLDYSKKTYSDIGNISIIEIPFRETGIDPQYWVCDLDKNNNTLESDSLIITTNYVLEHDSVQNKYRDYIVIEFRSKTQRDWAYYLFMTLHGTLTDSYYYTKDRAYSLNIQPHITRSSSIDLPALMEINGVSFMSNPIICPNCYQANYVHSEFCEFCQHFFEDFGNITISPPGYQWCYMHLKNCRIDDNCEYEICSICGNVMVFCTAPLEAAQRIQIRMIMGDKAAVVVAEKERLIPSSVGIRSVHTTIVANVCQVPIPSRQCV